jgi:apolipoprotein N-acyltransferase
LPGARFLVGAPSLVGAERAARYGLDSRGFSVSAYYLDPARYGAPRAPAGAGMLGRYDKIKLVPFGEYVPYVDVFPFLARLTPIGRGNVAGREYTVFELPWDAAPAHEPGAPSPLPFSALVCYDDCFPEVTARFRRGGARFMVNVTYEGWYHVPGELRQHLAMAVFRAVETRTTMVRAANTGISCFIDPLGRVYARLPADEPGALTAPVRLHAGLSFYARHVDVFAVLCLVFGAAAVGLSLYLRRPRAAGSRDWECGS